jgi:hypothetical protein
MKTSVVALHVDHITCRHSQTYLWLQPCGRTALPQLRLSLRLDFESDSSEKIYNFAEHCRASLRSGSGRPIGLGNLI